MTIHNSISFSWNRPADAPDDWVELQADLVTHLLKVFRSSSGAFKGVLVNREDGGRRVLAMPSHIKTLDDACRVAEDMARQVLCPIPQAVREAFEAAYFVSFTIGWNGYRYEPKLPPEDAPHAAEQAARLTNWLHVWAKACEWSSKEAA